MTTLTLESCVVDLATGDTTGARGQTRLSPQLVALLAWFAARPGEVISRERLHREVWGFHPDVVSRAADVAIRRLRARIESDPAKPRHLKSVRGEGWCFEPQQQAAQRPVSQHSPEWPATFDLMGRSDDLARLAEATRQPGLVTLHGPPGVGKSALAAHGHTGQEVRWWVPVQGLSTSNELLLAVASALRVSLPDSSEAVDALLRSIASAGTAHLVLDGADALVGVLAEMLPSWMRMVPELHILVTSREAIRVQGEVALAIGPLTPEDAQALFEARGGPSSSEAAELLVQLDGLPLAIELAAARCSVMAPKVLLERMERRFDLLTSRRRDASPHHRTLRVAIEVSWNLLSPVEQRVLGGCATFADGGTLEAIEDVLGDAVEEEMVLDVVQRLAEKSLLRPEEGRLRILRAIADFASAELDDETTRQLMQRHAEVVLRTAEPLLEGHIPAGGSGMSADLDPYLADLLLIERRFAGGVLGARATAAISPRRANMAELSPHLRRIDAARAVDGLSDDTAARLMVAQAFLLSEGQRADEASALLDALPADAPAMWRMAAEVVRTSNRVGRRDPTVVPELRDLSARLSGGPHRRWFLHTELNLAQALAATGSIAEARLHATAVIGHARAWGDRNFEGRAYLAIATFALLSHANAEAWNSGLESCRKALAAFEQQPVDRFRMFTYDVHGNLLSRLQRYEEATEAYTRGIEIARLLDAQPRMGRQLAWLATAHALQGHWDDAERELIEAEAICTAHDDVSGAALAQSRLGVIAQVQGRTTEAVHRYGLALQGMPSGLGPAGPHLHIMLCSARIEQGMVEEADRHLEIAEKGAVGFDVMTPYLELVRLHRAAGERVDGAVVERIAGPHPTNAYLQLYARIVRRPPS